MNASLLENVVSARLEGATDHRVAGRSADRLLGAFYTDTTATEAMARWIVRTPTDRILEPSFGNGAFLHATRTLATERGMNRVRHFGAELVQEPFSEALKRGLLRPANAFLGDFLALDPFPVDAVIGNPPYVRLRHLPPDQLARAMHTTTHVLGRPMETSGSIWMPFVLHCLRFLRPGGRLALVLPHELTHVRYARPLWIKLGETFANLRVARVKDRLFPDILQDVVILFGDGFSGSTRTVEFQALDHASEFAASDNAPRSVLEIADIVAGNRVFQKALLPASTGSLIDSLLPASTAPLPDRCTFNIGYVAGDKDYFHPSTAVAKEYGLSPHSLRPALTSSRQLRTAGLRTSNPTCHHDQLYLPEAEGGRQPESELNYIALGCRQQIHKRYKCRVRTPWYRVPGVRVPDLVLSVFAEQPVLLINDAGLVASNSLLCGYLRSGTAGEFAAAWYTSLTLLQCELSVHSLGGGVLILVPGEVASLRLPRCTTTKRHLQVVDRHLTLGKLDAAYGSGDKDLLRQQLGLSPADLGHLHAGIEVLRRWRSSSRTPVPAGLWEGSE